MIDIQAVRRWIMPALLPLALVAAGCQSKDSGPTGTGGTNTELDAAMVQDQAVSAMDFVNTLIDGVDEMASGDLSGIGGDLGLPTGSTLRTEPAAVWDAVQGAWVFDAQGSDTQEGATATYDVYLLVRFEDAAGAPQQEPDSTTTAMAVAIDYFVNFHGEEDGAVFDLELDYAMDLAVSGLQSGVYDIDGSGAFGIAMELSGDPTQEDLAMALSMGWSMDVTVPEQGCPSGTASVSVEQYRFDAVYDGQGGYAWTLRENSQTVDQGSEFVGCAVAAR